MRRIHVGLIAFCLCAAGVVGAASSDKVVTNPTPAVSATMDATSDGQGCVVWTVNGKVKPAYRGFGASVQLVCQKFPSVGACDLQTFPNNNCDGPCPPAQADACGNFSFTIRTCDPNPQLDNTNICTFLVHVDQAHVPNACSNKPPPPDTFPPDPNGSAPCSGGFCPDSP